MAKATKAKARAKVTAKARTKAAPVAARAKAPALVREGTAPPAKGGKGGGGAAVAVAPAAVAPVPTMGPRPTLELAPELWVGLPGKMAWNTGAICSGRWTVTAAALHGSVASKAMAWDSFQRFHKRQTEETGQSPEEHPVLFAREGTPAADKVTATITPAAGAWPFVRSDVVVDDFEGGNELGLGGSFFRVYVATDPAAPGCVLVPDIIGLNLGDPAKLWPSVVPGWLTDGFYVAVAAAPVEYQNRNVLKLRAALRALGG